MVALDDVVKARTEHLERLIEEVRKALEGPSAPADKVEWLKAVLGTNGFPVR